MEFFLGWLLLFILGGVILYELVSGRAFENSLKPTILRAERPGRYWTLVGSQAALILFAVFSGRTTLVITWAEVYEWWSEHRYEKAVELQREGKWSEAVAAFDKLAETAPGDARILYGRGVANRSLGNRDAALADFRRVIAIEPGHYPTYVEVDRILSFRGRWAELLALWGAYLAKNPGKAEAWYERGGTYFRMGNLEAARSDAAQACSLGLAAACKRVERLDAK